MSISLVDQRSQTVTLDQATQPGTVTFRRLIEDFGYDDTLKVVTRIIQEADITLGGDGDPSRCVPTAANAMISNGHRGLGFLIVAIREGMRRTDKDGRAYGKITAQLMNEWTATQEGEIVIQAVAEHSRTVAKNDNLGRDYMDRLEHDANADKRKVQRQSAVIEMLKAKLSTDEKDA